MSMVLSSLVDRGTAKVQLRHGADSVEAMQTVIDGSPAPIT